jgi:hypothetical protein
VNLKEDTEAVKKFLEEKKIKVPVAIDSDGKISYQYGADKGPVVTLVGKAGTLQAWHLRPGIDATARRFVRRYRGCR